MSEVLGVPGEVLGQECPVSLAAEPEHYLCLSLRVFLPSGEEDVNDQVLVPDFPQVYASLICFGTHLLKKSSLILLLFLSYLAAHFLLPQSAALISDFVESV